MTEFVSFSFHVTHGNEFTSAGQDLRTRIIHVLKYPPSLASASILKRARLLAISCKQNASKSNTVQPSKTKKKPWEHGHLYTQSIWLIDMFAITKQHQTGIRWEEDDGNVLPKQDAPLLTHQYISETHCIHEAMKVILWKETTKPWLDSAFFKRCSLNFI